MRNQDLLSNNIDESTFEFIIDVLDNISELRNGYFHRDNMTDLKQVINARNCARLVFYLILGAYNISEDDKIRLGYIQVEEHDDFYKLCEYTNKKAYASHPHLEIPIIYLNNKTTPYGFFYHDDNMEFDNYGDPIYSGVYFKKIGQDNEIIKITRDNLPKKIWEGTLPISKNTPIQFKFSENPKQLFVDGKFVDNDEDNG